MPTLDVNLKDLERLVGKKLPADLDELVMFVKGEIDSRDGDNIKLDVKETMRADLWSTEGIARELRARSGYEKGIPKYSFKKGNVTITINKNLEKFRPFIACAIARNVKLDDEMIKQIIQLQEKISGTFGKKRKGAGAGFYDFDKMTPPVFYKGYKDNEIEFVPLEWKVSMRPSEILKEHQKGKDYGHLLAGQELFPIVIDSANVVASMPPIINSEHTGKITEKTRNMFVEVTGNSWEEVNIALLVHVMALADRGATIEQVLVKFPERKVYPKQDTLTPFMNTKTIEVDPDFFRKRSGLSLKDDEIIKLLERARYNVTKKGKNLVCEYGSYRYDILHQVDVLEDMLISYGFNRIEPAEIKMPVKGFERKENKIDDIYRDICVGLGLQEVLTFTMTSREKQEQNIGLKDQQFVEIANFVSTNYQIFRRHLFPELLEFLAKNKNQQYPQRIFEIGKTLELDAKADNGTKEARKVSAIMSASKTNFTEIKSVLDAIANGRGFKYSLKESNLPFLEKGKAAEILANGKTIGFVGELNRGILANFSLGTNSTMLEIEVF